MRADKIRENRLRRAAQRQGLVLVKSRRRDPRATDYGRYWLASPGSSPTGQGLSLDDIETSLRG